MVITPDNKKIHFGSPAHENYTIHNDDKRKELYIARHIKNEDWDKTGLETAGFWSKHILWNKKKI